MLQIYIPKNIITAQMADGLQMAEWYRASVS